jgi:glycosyltransferase involved in cell wall biosynthesis
MKYSIIIPYRNREEHLQLLLPRLQEFFEKESYEIIISEQNDSDNFRIACVENVGFQYAKGDIIILQQVDYYPTEDVSYDVIDTPILPARKGIFLDKDNKSPRAFLDIPGGYRRWSEEIDPAFYGGVISMKREHFEAINGLNPLYKGWGNEDEDLRERFVWAGIPVKRNEVGTFLCLYHEDNGDMSKKKEDHQADFYEGRKYFYEQAYKDRHIGYKNLTADVEEFDCGIPNVKWIKSTNYKIKTN